jgi:hypothetical protein
MNAGVACVLEQGRRARFVRAGEEEVTRERGRVNHRLEAKLPEMGEPAIQFDDPDGRRGCQYADTHAH